jgi:hypothetical protein
MSDSSISGFKYAATGIVAALVQTPLDDATQYGGLISIIVSIVTGIVALFKFFKKDKK